MIILQTLVTYAAAGTWNGSAYELEPISLVTSSIGLSVLYPVDIVVWEICIENIMKYQY